MTRTKLIAAVASLALCAVAGAQLVPSPVAPFSYKPVAPAKPAEKPGLRLRPETKIQTRNLDQFAQTSKQSASQTIFELIRKPNVVIPGIIYGFSQQTPDIDPHFHANTPTSKPRPEWKREFNGRNYYQMPLPIAPPPNFEFRILPTPQSGGEPRLEVAPLFRLPAPAETH